MSNSSSNSGGIGVLGLLGVAFVALKLMGVIDWSWWYVTLPFWGELALGLMILIPYLIYLLFQSMKKKRKLRKSIDIMKTKQSARLLTKPKNRFQTKMDEMMEISKEAKISKKLDES
jgi:hypothetical protein